MINAAQLANFRAFAALSFDKTAKIERQQGTTKDAAGHVVENWATLQAAQPCRLTEPSYTERQIYADAIGTRSAWKIIYGTTGDIQRNDRVTIDGLLMQVQTSNISESSYQTANAVLATLIV